MRILKTVHSLNPAGGGVATAVDALSRAAIALGHTVEVACLDDPASAWLANLPYKVHAFRPAIFRSYGWCPALTNWLRSNIRHYDVATVEGLWQYHGQAVWKATQATKIPYVVYPHGMLDPWFQRAYPRKHFKKMLYWKLGGHRILRDARAVAFTTEEEMRLAENSFQPWQARSVISPLGVQLPSNNSAERTELWRKRFPQLGGNKYLLFLGRIDPKKGVDFLLSAYASIYSAADRSSDTAPVLVLAGPELHPEFSSICRNLIQQMGLCDGVDVIWTGNLDHDLKWAALESADALVLPSHQENFGYVVAEALAAGTPVLISDKVNLFREVVADGAGMAAADDAEGTRKLIEIYRSWSLEDRQRLSTAARKSFMARYQIEAAALRQIAVLGGAN
jgi:glycosyltransferase involved in cell wall biosynthesis